MTGVYNASSGFRPTLHREDLEQSTVRSARALDGPTERCHTADPNHRRLRWAGARALSGDGPLPMA